MVGFEVTLDVLKRLGMFPGRLGMILEQLWMVLRRLGKALDRQRAVLDWLWLVLATSNITVLSHYWLWVALDGLW